MYEQSNKLNLSINLKFIIRVHLRAKSWENKMQITRISRFHVGVTLSTQIQLPKVLVSTSLFLEKEEEEKQMLMRWKTQCISYVHVGKHMDKMHALVDCIGLKNYICDRTWFAWCLPSDMNRRETTSDLFRSKHIEETSDSVLTGGLLLDQKHTVMQRCSYISN